MLLELAVENYAVVDRLRVRFHAGLNLLTGETGSGKSIVVDALGLLWGGRASSDVIRTGETKARVSGRFDIGERAIERVLQPAGFEAEDGELLIEREILSNGKSRVYVGSRPATVALLRELAAYLGDIHGQHDQQLLYLPEAQLDILDGFAQAREQRRAVRAAHAAWQAAQAELQALEAAEQDKLRLLDLWQFQAGEIEAEAPQGGEDAALEEERRVQMNAGKLLENASAALELLYDAEESAYSSLRSSIRKLDDALFTEARQLLEPAVIAVQEASHSLRGSLDKLEANPARLEEIETRLAALGKLKRKYGATVAEVLRFLETVRAQIAAAQSSEERMTQLRSELGHLGTAYETAAGELTGIRTAAAAELARRVELELAHLAMERTVFQVALTSGSWSENGVDRVQFLVSPNRGEEPKPMDRIASGGEISRIALALKTCVIGAQRVGPLRTLVFDEVDTGIGGMAADGVARRLKQLAQVNQVLCVTHLPQIASFADHHYRVEKVDVAGRTVARMEELSADARRQEIGRMLSGARLTPEALRNADEMIRTSQSG